MRRTLVVGSRTASQEARFRAALAGDCGLQILTVSRLAGRLAGGFIEAVSSDILQVLVKEALEAGGFQAIQSLAGLPGMVRAVISTLTKAWNAALDLQAQAPKHPRIADLALLESRIIAGLPKAMLLPREVARLAVDNIGSAATVLGPIKIEGVCDLALCWRQLIRELANVIPVEWHALAGEDLTWLENSSVKIVRREAQSAMPEAIVCANPRHEAIEALRWARQLIASGKVMPGEIAITAAAVDPWDDHIRVIADEAGLPVVFAHGRAALSTFPGQQAAAVADVLLRGLSRSRVMRVISLCRASAPVLSALPGAWKQAIKTDSSLMNLQQWERMWADAAALGWPEEVDQRVILRPILNLLARGKDAAGDAGEMLLRGQALALWREALREGPPAALETNLTGLRVEDKSEPAVSIFWGPAHALVTAPRKCVCLLGLNSRNWPQPSGEDPLLPEYIVPARELDPLPVDTRDRMNFRRIMATAAEVVVLSRSRRDGEGRLLGKSPLFPRDLSENSLVRTRVPEHAVSEADRLLARRGEFGAMILSQCATKCWQDWRQPSITVHDGQTVKGSSIVARALNRTHSPTSLRKLLRDPIGFLWAHVFGWEGPLVEEDILSFDRAQFGTLVHEILAEVVKNLEDDGGLGEAKKATLERTIEIAADKVRKRWETEESVPPLLIWQGTLRQAIWTAGLALTAGEEGLTGQESWVELWFGHQSGRAAEETCPWNSAVAVEVPGAGILIQGKIDRLDLDRAKKVARLTDYKTGKFNTHLAKDPLDGGKELQRSLYYLAAKSLLASAEIIQSRLLYPGIPNGLCVLDNPEENIQRLAGYLKTAKQLVLDGLTIPGAESQDEYNDLLFAFPSNAPVQYLAEKLIASRTLLAGLVTLWENSEKKT